mgnify:CR=1 FL=1|jgi:hypothetical protein
MNNASNFHVSYPDVYRHWSANCEEYAGGDCLLTALREGWQIPETIYSENFWHSGARLVIVFHFDLTRGDETMAMPVLSNPFVRRLIRQESLTVKPLDERRMRRERDADAV